MFEQAIVYDTACYNLDCSCHIYNGCVCSSELKKGKNLESRHQTVIGLCCPVLSHVFVCYESQPWTLTALCIKSVSIADKIGRLGDRSTQKWP